MRRATRVLLSALIAMVALVPMGAGASSKAVLAPGRAVFWTGPMVEGPSGGPYEYRLQVRERAFRLRIAFDHPEVGDVFNVEITGPKGTSATLSPGGGLYSVEHLFFDPDPGTWTIRVTAEDVSNSRFRVRAKLEKRAPSIGVKKGPVLPNLQILPPHEASFLVPVTNGAADAEPTGVDAAGQSGCHPEEHSEDGAVRCLRFAYGVRNTGKGPMDLRVGAATGVPFESELFQTVHLANGNTVERQIGIARYHKTHAHYHHDAAIGLQLHRVVDPKTGELEAAGEPRTKGFAHRMELLREWGRFYPDFRMSGFGLGPGWADIYEWDRPGNYIDFGLNPDGRYVVRMQADPVNAVWESNEKDNLGYAYIDVAGSVVDILEVGRGRDPWDRCKIVVGEGGHPDPVQPPRPADCPKDTV
jgi:hypothetical protein